MKTSKTLQYPPTASFLLEVTAFLNSLFFFFILFFFARVCCSRHFTCLPTVLAEPSSWPHDLQLLEQPEKKKNM
jgi:hypothetical protein